MQREVTNIVCWNTKSIKSKNRIDQNGLIVSNIEKFVDNLCLVDNEILGNREKQSLRFETISKIPKVGFMIVGLGGNNGTTFAATTIANKNNLSYETKTGVKWANWFGSISMTGTVQLGQDMSTGDVVYVPVRNLLPVLDPNDVIIGGWEINAASMSEAMKRAAVLPLEVQRAVKEEIDKICPLPGIYDKDFIATNQEIRADYILSNMTKTQQVERIRQDILNFKKIHRLDKVIVMWSANTERFSSHSKIHDTEASLMKGIADNEQEIAPSLLYAVAAVLEECAYINGSPQNTFCRGLVEMATKRNILLGGDDFKTGQTKFKSVVADFLVSTAIKPTAIVSYNHLGNNDGLNLSSHKQFRSKEITKSSVVDDIIASNNILYQDKEKPDHLIVIKYIPTVGDSKRALDEYTSEICMNGQQTIVVHNTCEDSLLAVPIMLDLFVFIELIQRVSIELNNKKVKMHSLVSLLSLFLKAPQVPEHAPIINSLFPQREGLLDFIKLAAGFNSSDYLAITQRLRKN